MSWATLDDQFANHPKIAPLSDAAFRAYVTALLWCNAYITDGSIPAGMLERLISATRPATRKSDGAGHSRDAILAELLEAGLWHERETENGNVYEIHDFLDYNRSAEQVRRARRAAALRQKRYRDSAISHGSSDAKSNGVTDASRDGVNDADPHPPPIEERSYPLSPFPRGKGNSNFIQLLRTLAREVSDGDRLSARSFQAAMVAALQRAGCEVSTEVAVGGRRIDIAVEAPVKASLELDRVTPRKNSIAKLRQREGLKVIVLREGVDARPPEGIDAVVGCLKRYIAEPAEQPPSRLGERPPVKSQQERDARDQEQLRLQVRRSNGPGSAMTAWLATCLAEGRTFEDGAAAQVDFERFRAERKASAQVKA